MAAAATGTPEEIACRYCFEGEEEGPLIAPCKCSGGQKWVHLSCLRRWQRGVLVSQPTHPDFYEDDVRDKICNVCKSAFTCKPPTRLELMSSFTGEELAALVEEKCFIASHRDFSAEMKRNVEVFPPHLRDQVVDRHWVNGVFLIAQVVEDGSNVVKLRIDDDEGLAMFATELSLDGCWQVRHRRYRLICEGPLQEVASADGEAKRAAVRALRSPVVLKFSPAEEPDCGEDGIVAVNLTQPFDLSVGWGHSPHIRKRLRYQSVLSKVFPADGPPLLPCVKVTHFVGGPCHKDKVKFTMVISGPEDYHFYPKLEQALQAAQEIGLQRSGNSSSSSSVHAPAANGADTTVADGNEASPRIKRRRLDVSEKPVGLAGTASTSSAAASVRLESAASSGASSPSAGADIRVNVFWGTAGWSRCQLVGEIASGSWGLCKSAESDVTVTKPEDLWESVYSRLIFAPKTEMSENHDNAHGDAAIDPVNDPEIRARLLQVHRLFRRREQRRLAEAAAEAAAQERASVRPDLVQAAMSPNMQAHMQLDDLLNQGAVIGNQSGHDADSASEDCFSDSTEDDDDGGFDAEEGEEEELFLDEDEEEEEVEEEGEEEGEQDVHSERREEPEQAEEEQRSEMQ
eukprot:gnl/TRDRNA2_/TRDRNA2_150393_c0_seq2.p1 gnl/TRDRNA2_/TRDRNA2_150393_c0~~gnl/TRDRNA2_/TRDRNA2_150393_c0_seq2.p1  ORF type:complete len:662 (+),score=136.32 gnl/TRDRNA2_/TRDRNA2_150393_c0_seq2:104-1987(+)